MIRAPQLRGLSSEHHHALRLARTVTQSLDRAEPLAPLAEQIRAAFTAELATHFAIEERTLLPALAAAGRADLVARTRAEHDELRALALHGTESGHEPTLRAFATLLAAHVRFEERELFPALEALGDEALAGLTR